MNMANKTEHIKVKLAIPEGFKEKLKIALEIEDSELESFMLESMRNLIAKNEIEINELIASNKRWMSTSEFKRESYKQYDVKLSPQLLNYYRSKIWTEGTHFKKRQTPNLTKYFYDWKNVLPTLEYLQQKKKLKENN